MKKTITVKFYTGEMVALRTDPSVKRVVTGIVIRPSGKMYELACGVDTTWHQDVEIETFPDKKPINGFKR